MIILRFFLMFMTFCSFCLPAFAGVNDDIEKAGQYWQRVHTSSALYLRGPKAQQMLNRDIARCVTELREMERLGAVKDAIPKYAQGIVMSNADEAKLAGWDMPERDRDLLAEHTDYIDFEGCMLAKGWERIKYVPFDVAREARENYLNTHVAHRPRKEIVTHASTHRSKSKRKTGSDYDHLND